jgi:hypothetical protein
MVLKFHDGSSKDKVSHTNDWLLVTGNWLFVVEVCLEFRKKGQKKGVF